MDTSFFNQLNEGQDKEKKKLYKKISAIAAGVVVAIFAVIFISYLVLNRTFESFEIVQERERADSHNVMYEPYKNQLLKYSTDGISMVDKEGKDVWNGGYEMEKPVVDQAGNYVLVADVEGKQFYIYNGKDAGVQIETTLPIERAKVSADGHVAVLLQDEDSDCINIYNPYSTTHSLEVEVPTNVLENGYVLDYDISPDGDSLVVAYMLVKNGAMENKVCFYNFSDIGQDQNMLVGGKSYETSMIGRIEFVAEDEVAIMHETGFDLFSNMKKPTPNVEKTFDQSIKSADCNEEHVLVILGEGDTSTLHLYNLRGKEELEQSFFGKYSKVQLTKQEIIFYDNQNCYILRTNGKEKLNYKFAEECDYFFPAEGDNQYYYLDEAKIQLVKLAG